jgi:NADP-dependent 3-hydroxy acid dehydrogenase YdfG
MKKPVAIVTGANRGIGQAIALKFAKEGFAVALTARDRKKLNETHDIITSSGFEKPFIIQADLRNLNQVEEIVRQVVKTWGKIDVLVNNAGLGYLKPFLEISPDEYDEMMEVNTRAVFFLTQYTVTQMMEKKSGLILNIASLAGKNGFKSGTGYAASKWALRGFAQCLLHEVREHDIRVVTIFPGSVETNFGQGGQSPIGTPSQNKIQPEDIANVAFMAYHMPQRTMVSEIDMRPSNPRKGS